MTYEIENEAKANFDDVYVQPTPHDYISEMAENGYEIGEQARPYCATAANLLSELNGDAWPVQMLDVGCSYGIGSAFVKYNCAFDEMVAFFSTRVPSDYQSACEATRNWLNVTAPEIDMRCVGLDSSHQAIRFAIDAGLLDGGITRDFESPKVKPEESDIAWFKSCNLLICTGAIGYLGERTFDWILKDLGEDYPGRFGPFNVLTILRMFDDSPIREVYEKNGFQFGRIDEVRLPQRRFRDISERDKVLSILDEKGLDTEEHQEKGRLFADLYIAARKDQFPLLYDSMVETHGLCKSDEFVPAYIKR